MYLKTGDKKNERIWPVHDIDSQIPKFAEQWCCCLVVLNFWYQEIRMADWWFKHLIANNFVNSWICGLAATIACKKLDLHKL